MTALGGQEVEATFSAVHGLQGGLLGSAAAQPHQATGEDGADLAQMGREVGVGGGCEGAGHVPEMAESLPGTQCTDCLLQHPT